MEELKQQLAESLPGAVSLFAEAYQMQLADQGKGGGLTGSDAIQALNKAMEAGDVKASVLTYAGRVASQRANAGGALTSAAQASQAQQARYQNALNDQAVIASNSGVESGFARIFRTLATGLNESTGLVRNLAESFDSATVQLEKILLFPQSFSRALEGRDSLVADWLGLEATEQLRDDWNTIKETFDAINSMSYPAWMPTLEATAKEIAAVLQAASGLMDWGTNLNKSTNPGADEASFWRQPITATWQTIGRTWNGFFENAQAATERNQAISNPDSPYYNDASGYDAQRKQREMSEAQDIINNAALPNIRSMPKIEQNNQNTFNIEVALQTDNTADFDTYFRNQFQQSLGQLAAETRTQFPEVE